MDSVRRAVIDVGTNSVKLLVADVSGGEVRPVVEQSRQTRLGQGFYDTHRLQPESLARTAEAVREFGQIAREQAAADIRVIATSAARDAVNPEDLTQAIERASGLRTEIISGAVEAEWAFLGAATDRALARQPMLLLDVGGGSTEFILGRAPRIHFARSFPLGTVRLLEMIPVSDPPTPSQFEACRDWLQQCLRRDVLPQLQPALQQESGEVQLVGTGGTTSILARIEKELVSFDRGQIESTVLTFAQVAGRRENLWRLPLAGRKEITGLPPNRADVILPGVLIYEVVMREFGFPQLRVSTRGLRFAAVMAP
jgi:exopolyphosphatase/guanosine-5'-triphosphate,3'-diphosphate pyrophosphatase